MFTTSFELTYSIRILKNESFSYFVGFNLLIIIRINN